MQLRLKLTDSCLYVLYTDVKLCVLLYIVTLYWRLILLFFYLSSPLFIWDAAKVSCI
jgi:hypothetical protein